MWESSVLDNVNASVDCGEGDTWLSREDSGKGGETTTEGGR